MRIFRNKKTGKRLILNEYMEKRLIKSLEKDEDYQELENLGA